jgi:hypothetical protein
MCTDYSLQLMAKQIIRRTCFDTILHWSLQAYTQGRAFQRGSNIEYVQVFPVRRGPVGAKLARDGVLKIAIARKPCSYKKAD